MKKIILFIVIIINLTACVEVIDIDLDPKDRFLVLNGFISPDSLIKVNLSTSINALDGDAFIKFIDDAHVILYENGDSIETMQKDTFGYFISTIKPDLNKSYSVSAKSGKYPQLYATTTVPESVPIKELEMDIQIDSVTETWYNIQTGQPFDTTLYTISGDGTVYVSFDDPNEKNYYLLSFSIIKPNFIWDDYGNQYITGYYEQSIWYQLDGSSENVEYFSLSSIANGFVFNDEFFSGTEKKLKTTIYTWDIYDEYSGYLPESPLYVHLYTLSEDLYNYIISYNKYQEIIGNPFAEPVNIFSNVTNGLGLLGGLNVTTDSVEIVVF